MKVRTGQLLAAIAQAIAVITITYGFQAPARAASQSADTVQLMHVHGLSYSADGAKIFIPSHRGLVIYSQGRWSTADGSPHDFMGFSATRDALYSSGHPAPGTNLVNPFGLIKSQDEGRTWKKLGFEGQSDFHTLATSYGTNTVYVLNQSPNDRMKQPGIYVTQTDGAQWTLAQGEGLTGSINSLAAHPTNSKVLAAGMDKGLYISEDGAKHFQLSRGGEQVLAMWFDLDGSHLWYSHYAGKPALTRITWQNGKETQDIPLPLTANDAVAYIAQNPITQREIVIATFKRSVYLSEDLGQTWKQIAKNGQTL
ncbi:MAG: F510_1955 family glycosylhydrolase [Paralcaligenes sp.]